MTLRMIQGNVARLAGVAVILAGTAFAQSTQSQSPAPSRPAPGAMATPQTSAADRMASNLTRQLGLSDAQAQQVKQLMESRQEKMMASRNAMMAARETLRKAAQTSPVDEAAIRSAAQALGQAEGDSALLQAQLHSQIDQILNDEQKKKFAAMSGPVRGPAGPPAMHPNN